MSVLVPILADFGDVVGFIVFVVIMLLGAAGQFMNKAKEAQQKKIGPRQAGPGRPQRLPQQGPLASEIEDFVRKAAERRAGGGVQPGRQPQAGQRPPAGQPRPAGRPPQMPPRPAARPPLAARPVREVPVEVELLEPVDESQSVSAHVRSHVGRHGGDETLGKVASRHISSRVESADQEVDSRVHEVFDHKLGSLKDMPDESAARAETPADRGVPFPATAAAGVAAMFANPGNIRQAILINEILQRPEHRWS
jgi:hypothetical protein